MDTLLIVLSAIFAIVGCIGCIVPILPGVMLTFAGYLCLYFTDGSTISPTALIIYGIITLAVSLLDYLLPSVMTKRFGGTKAGERGAMAGVIAGMFFGPVGIIVAPFIGAVVAELINDSSNRERALKAGLGSFLAFFIGTGLKLLVAMCMTFAIIKSIFNLI